MYLCPL